MSSPGEWDRAVPNLPSRNFDATEAFYSSFGFERAFRDDGWMILVRGSLQLEFFPHPALDPAKSDFMCSLRVANVDELFEAIIRAGVNVGSIGVPRLHAVRTQPWGLRAGYLIDLDGTQLALIEQAPPELPLTAR
ncbi:bleomycin resistance protein [Microbacterium sp. W1N]|uniref:bleomycin resistance protein n=1 Tax=Microbacterium festucae TaxID=2977531 RepID=UPI0021C0E00D|nr:bleomycin resistance protein [Microbacterium festucae]MCT9820795.1 bleomycin resistance protein [Microbacterium festucae]